MAFRARFRTFPGVSAPSSVVRSTIEIARSIAASLDARLMDRVASPAARCSTPTGSTPGSPSRKHRNEDSSAVASARCDGSGAADPGEISRVVILAILDCELVDAQALRPFEEALGLPIETENAIG